MLDHKLLEIVVCPVCKGRLIFRREHQDLVCRADRLAYPIKDNIPVLLEDEAKHLASDELPPAPKVR